MAFDYSRQQKIIQVRIFIKFKWLFFQVSYSDLSLQESIKLSFSKNHKVYFMPHLLKYFEYYILPITQQY